MSYRTDEEDRVLEGARKYARMKVFGRYVENDQMVFVGHQDRDAYTKHFADDLLRRAESLLVAMATDEENDKLVE